VRFPRFLRLPSLPTQCAVCRDWSNERVCGPCIRRFAAPVARCQRCALRVPSGRSVCGACLKDPPPQDRALAALDYGHPWDPLIARFKFNDALDLAEPFARLLGEAWRAGDVPPADWLLPVPLAAARLRERGYNQSWEIARRIAAQLGTRADAGLLLRLRDTPHQLAFPVERRAANVHGAFAVEPTRTDELRGRHVAVIDDVMTTGATAAEIARTLKQAGAAQVTLCVLARTPSPGE
jgi:ComF family protein